MENVVVSIFAVESEAFQAFTELRQMPLGEGYTVAEAALVKNQDGFVTMEDAFGMRAADADSTTGILIGSLVGILGGPIGVILGATTGAAVGSVSDLGRTVDYASVVAVVADKIYDDEIAIVALVREEEPAFDVVFQGFAAQTMRYDAADIAADVDRMIEVQDEISRQVIQEAKADRKAERASRREERRAAIEAKINEFGDSVEAQFEI